MAKKKFSQLPAGSLPLSGSEIMAGVQNGESVQFTAQDVANLGGGSPSTTEHVDKTANFTVSTADTKKLYVIDSASLVTATLPDLTAEIVDYEWAFIVVNSGGGLVDPDGNDAENTSGSFDFADINVIMYLYYDHTAQVYYFQNGTAGGGATPTLDEVLASGSTLTDDREIIIGLNEYRETATGPTDYSQRTIDQAGVQMTHSSNDNTQQTVISVEDDILITDTRSGRGLQGQQNFSSNIQANDFVQKNYVDSVVAGLIDLKGDTDTSANPNYPSALKGDAYYVTVAGKIGGASGKSVDVGDVYVAKADNAGGTEASVGTSWFVLEHNLAGVLLLSGGTMTGNIAMGSNKVTGLAAATTNGDAVRFEQLPGAASESTAGIIEIATQAEANAGTDDARAMTPLKALVKNRKEATKTSGYTVAQTDDQGFLIANSASAIAFDFPSLEAGTIVTIIQINAGDLTWTNSGGTSFVGNITTLLGGTLGAATFRYRSTTVIEVFGGMPTSAENMTVNGTLYVKAGASSGAIAKVGGTISVDSTQTGNITTGVDTIQTYSLPANILFTDKDSIRGFVAGTFAANANNKQVILKFGATTLFATGAVAFNTGDWRIDFEVIRTGAATQKASARWTCDNTSLDESHDYTTPAETLSGAVTILVTGEGTSTNDIVKEMFKISFDPAP